MASWHGAAVRRPKVSEGKQVRVAGFQLFGVLIRQFVGSFVFQRNIVETLDKIAHLLVVIGVLSGSKGRESWQTTAVGWRTMPEGYRGHASKINAASVS